MPEFPDATKATAAFLTALSAAIVDATHQSDQGGHQAEQLLADLRTHLESLLEADDTLTAVDRAIALQTLQQLHRAVERTQLRRQAQG